MRQINPDKHPLKEATHHLSQFWREFEEEVPLTPNEKIAIYMEEIRLQEQAKDYIDANPGRYDAKLPSITDVKFDRVNTEKIALEHSLKYLPIEEVDDDVKTEEGIEIGWEGNNPKRIIKKDKKSERLIIDKFTERAVWRVTHYLKQLDTVYSIPEELKIELHKKIIDELSEKLTHTTATRKVIPSISEDIFTED